MCARAFCIHIYDSVCICMRVFLLLFGDMRDIVYAYILLSLYLYSCVCTFVSACVCIFRKLVCACAPPKSDHSSPSDYSINPSGFG